jgi:thermostable 8-oxoguanine DNA glycosylase
MRTLIAKGNVRTLVEPEDRRRIYLVLWRLGPHAKLERLLAYRSMSSAELWYRLASQVCSLGSAAGMAAIAASEPSRRAFERAISLGAIARQPQAVSYLEQTLRRFGATRAPKRAAKLLVKLAQSPKAVRGRRVVLLEGLSHEGDPNQIREQIMERCPVLALDSASDLMIALGLSHEVMALDHHVVGALRRFFGYNRTTAQVQARPEAYLSLEAALRKLCHDADSSPAVLDRALYQFAGMNLLDFAMTQPIW